jgi:hypothetical protein
VVESGRMVVVKATVTIPVYAIEVEQYGGNDNPDRGDAYKGACTDALSKCASYLGVGMDVYKGLRDERLKNGLNGQNGSAAGSQRTPHPNHLTGRQNGAGNGRPEPTGLTTKNMVERFATMRTIIGMKDYEAILAENGYRDVTNIQTLDRRGTCIGLCWRPSELATVRRGRNLVKPNTGGSCGNFGSVRKRG